MTKIITRYFESASRARSVKHQLVQRERFSARDVSLLEDAGTFAEKLLAANVQPKTVDAYQKRMENGGAVVMVRAGYKPLGIARITREVTAQMGAVDMGRVSEEVSLSYEPRRVSSVMRDHPLMLSRFRDPDSNTYHMANWPIPLTIRTKRFSGSIFEPHARMANWPFKLISKRRPYTGSIFEAHARMANFPIGLTSKRRPFTGSIFSRHARMANFPIGLISKRRPWTATIFGRHQRMANWPFPLLINGKMGQNALMPGGPRMANFPISLLSQRKPFTGSIFSRHARMASFPIGLLSNRKPYTGSIMAPHARMADDILPLVVKHGEDPTCKHDDGFSLSRLLRIPTTSRR
ncbi:MAG: PucR family transcriptional regulator [Pseudomonadota bacterium]